MPKYQEDDVPQTGSVELEEECVMDIRNTLMDMDIESKTSQRVVKESIEKQEDVHGTIIEEIHITEDAIKKENDIQKKENETLKKEHTDMKKALDFLKKEDSQRKKECKKLKEENVKLNLEIGKLHCDKDNDEAKVKAEEKLKKMKKNTQLFNKILEKQLADGEIKNVDLSKYQEDGKEELYDERSNTVDSYNLQSLLTNKLKGGKRANPQEKSDMPKLAKKKDKVELFKCPQCDFISQNEIFFNEHVLNAHAGQPTCPFCYEGFKRLSIPQEALGYCS